MIGVRHTPAGPVVTVDAVDASVLAAVLDRAYAMHRARSGELIPQAGELIRALRYVAALRDLLAVVPHAEQQMERGAEPRNPLSVKQVAHALGIGDRAVRQRIARGQLRATRVGRDWQVAAQDIPTRKEAS